MKSKMRSIRKTALIFLLVSVLLAAAIRITSVNAAAEKPIIDTYSQNEWVPLGGSYFRSYQENTNGYSVMITGHEIIDRKDYLEKYGLDPSSVNEENSFRYIMEVSLTIRNENNEEGKIMIGDWARIGKKNDYSTYLDQQLLMDTDERIDSILSSISTAPGKDIEMKLPFPMRFIDDEKELDKNAPYKMAVTKYPARQYIYLE